MPRPSKRKSTTDIPDNVSVGISVNKEESAMFRFRKFKPGKNKIPKPIFVDHDGYDDKNTDLLYRPYIPSLDDSNYQPVSYVDDGNIKYIVPDEEF